MALGLRVGVWAAGRDPGDDKLDASDLIYTSFGEEWDGIDNDENGYVDDISGWDFFGNDNDPWHEWYEGYGTHGTDVMREAAAEGKNLGEDGGGGIGICPNCSILPARIGDSFVTDGQRAGEAVVFAVDSGAVAVNLAVGALSNPSMTVGAASYAWDNGVLIVGAAGDEKIFLSAQTTGGGKRTAFLEARISNTAGEPIATAQAAFKLMPPGSEVKD